MIELRFEAIDKSLLKRINMKWCLEAEVLSVYADEEDVGAAFCRPSQSRASGARGEHAWATYNAAARSAQSNKRRARRLLAQHLVEPAGRRTSEHCGIRLSYVRR